MEIFQAKVIKTSSDDPDLYLILITRCPKCKCVFASPSRDAVLPGERQKQSVDENIYHVEWIDANTVRLTSLENEN